jgi:hypothetical protein
MGTMKLWTLPEKNYGWNSYEFEELEGRTSAELEDLVLYQDLMMEIW